MVFQSCCACSFTIVSQKEKHWLAFNIQSCNSRLTSCQWGPITANEVDLLTETWTLSENLQSNGHHPDVRGWIDRQKARKYNYKDYLHNPHDYDTQILENTCED